MYTWIKKKINFENVFESPNFKNEVRTMIDNKIINKIT